MTSNRKSKTVQFVINIGIVSKSCLWFNKT